MSLGFFGAGGSALWADLTQRDASGFVTTGAHDFSTTGAALVTAPADLDSPGVGWLYSSVVLGKIRIRVAPSDPNADLFVGIARSSDVDRYLARVSHTLISDFWTERTQSVAGDASATAPTAQDFWVASATGKGPQSVTWDSENGSWTVVVMNGDGQPGLDVSADLGATHPGLRRIGIVSLVLAAVFLIGGIVLLTGARRRIRGITTVSDR
jgi:hypothetical protein